MVGSGSSARSRARALGGARRRLCALAIAASLAGTTSPVLAQPAPQAAASAPAPDDALRRAQRMLLERAKTRYEAGRAASTQEEARPHLEGALDAIHLAYGLIPAPWLLFNMAQVESRLGACTDAAELYRRFLASGPAPEARRSAEQALQLLGACPAESVLPSSADGLPSGLILPSGAAAAEGAELAAAVDDAPGELPPAAAPAETDELGVTATALPWALGSLALMSGVAGAVYWAEAHSAKRDLDGLRVGGPLVAETQQRGESAQDLARLFGGLAVGLGLAAGATYWWFRAGREEPADAGALGSVSVVPLPGGAAAAYSGAF